eukprot:8463098-Lingulodinium_polyedra.AAC.1
MGCALLRKTGWPKSANTWKHLVQSVTPIDQIICMFYATNCSTTAPTAASNNPTPRRLIGSLGVHRRLS